DATALINEAGKARCRCLSSERKALKTNPDQWPSTRTLVEQPAFPTGGHGTNALRSLCVELRSVLRGCQAMTDSRPQPPAPIQIRQARLTAGLTQQQAAQTVLASLRGWQQWEAGERGMPA